MMKNEAKIETALATMKAAQDAHGALVAAKFAATGKSVGMWAPEIDNDVEIIASHKRAVAAERAYARLCR